MKLGKLARTEAREFYLLISPWLIGFAAFAIGPIIASFFFSFHDYNVVESPIFVGMKNYKMLIDDELFWLSLYNTLYMTVFGVPLGIICALIIALLLNQKVPGMSLFRTIYYLPTVVPVVANSILWLWILNPEYGLLNSFLKMLHLPPLGWLVEPRLAKPTLILMGLWGLGGNVIIYLAGLQGIPQQLYEAAAIDGASRWSRFWRITVPLLSSIIFFTLIMGVIGSLQIFTKSYIMTGGGPLNSTRFYVLYLFQVAFHDYRMGYGSAMAWILFIIIFVITIFLFRSVGRRVYYEKPER